MVAYLRANLYHRETQVRSNDQRCLPRNGSTQRSTVSSRGASSKKRTDAPRNCLGNTSSSLHSRGSSMLSMTGNWNWSSTGMSGRRAKGLSLSGASLCCCATALDLGHGEECLIVSTGIDCNSSRPLSVESHMQHPRSVGPEGRCVTSEESSGEARMWPNRRLAVVEDTLRQFNCPADWRRNAGNPVGATSADIVGVFFARGLGFSVREDVGGRMSNAVLRRLCLERFTSGSYRQELSKSSASCYTPQQSRTMGSNP